MTARGRCFRFTRAKAIARKEKLHFHAHIWYKVSRSERVSYNGITPASQADNEGSIPFTRSTSLFQHVPAYPGEQLKPRQTGLLSRFFCVRMISVDAPH